MKDSCIHEKMSSDDCGFEAVKMMGLINVTVVFPQSNLFTFCVYFIQFLKAPPHQYLISCAYHQYYIETLSFFRK